MKQAARVIVGVLAGLGGLVALLAVVVVMMFPSAMESANANIADALAHGERAITSIVDNWDEQELFARSTFEHRQGLQSRGMTNVFWFSRELGPLTVLGECTAGNAEFRNGEGWVEVFCAAEFSGGSAIVWAQLYSTSGTWKLMNFEVRLPIAVDRS